MRKLLILTFFAAVIILFSCTSNSIEESQEPFESKQHNDSESKESFKIKRPWLLPDLTIIDNPEYNSSKMFSHKYSLEDNIDIPFILNADYLGEWVVYGSIDKVNIPHEEVSSETLFNLLKVKGYILTGDEKDSNWRGIRFFENSIVETDSGNQVMTYTQSDFWGSQWTDGWIISEKEKAKAHSIIYKGDDYLLFFELKNGDYFRGSAPSYIVFKKQ